MGKSGTPNKTGGYRVPYPEGSEGVALPAFKQPTDVTLRLQNGWKTSELQ